MVPGGQGDRIMDLEPGDLRPRRSNSLGGQSSANASLRRSSFALSGRFQPHFDDDDAESECVSEAGDIGDRALNSNRCSENGSFRISLDKGTEHGVVVPDPEDISQPNGSCSHDPKGQNTVTLAQPLQSDIKIEDQNPFLPKLEYISCLLHLAVFGILGTLTRYLLQQLFGPGQAGVTMDGSILYLDLPSNMVGSFLMGWFGVVFKSNIVALSDQLAIGLSTGYLGSLTTFSGWNQKMLDLAVHGHWVFVVLGYLVGLFLAAYSIIFGIETAQGFKWLLLRHGKCSSSCAYLFNNSLKVDSLKRHVMVVVALIFMWGSLLAVSGTLEKREFKNGGKGTELWLGCLVAPLGVWMRWWLARLNGRGLGRAGLWKWIPFGTLIANVSAACMMAALATIKEAVNTQTSDTVATGIQFGFLGCLSTVSTFIAEFNAMRLSNHPWRAYTYAIITLVISFGLGTMIYSVHHTGVIDCRLDGLGCETKSNW